MEISTSTWYKCDYCGNSYTEVEKARECEEKCKQIVSQVETIVKACSELKKLGVNISLRDSPFYKINKFTVADMDERTKRMLSSRSRELGLCIEEEQLEVKSICSPIGHVSVDSSDYYTCLARHVTTNREGHNE
jgi:hypothetical protein